MNERNHTTLNDEDNWNFEGAFLLAGFALRAVRRRRRFALTCWIATIALAIVGLVVMPKTYRVDSRILTHPAYILPSLSHPNRPIPVEEQSQRGTRGAAELIKSRETLSNIIDDVGLMKNWAKTRGLGGRLADGIRNLFVGKPKDSEFREMLVETLDKNLTPMVEGDVVSITLNWHHAQSAVAIVEAAQRRFLEERHERDMGEIRETMKILERSVIAAKPGLDAATERLRTAAAARRAGRRIPAPRAIARPAETEKSTEMSRAEQDLNKKREEIQRIQGGYDQRVRTAESRLKELRGSLAPTHPDVVDAVREVEQASRAPEELASLRAEELMLAQQVRQLGGSGTPRNADLIQEATAALSPGNDPEMERIVREYQSVEAGYRDVENRLEDARIELQAADAAFNYRYRVTVPPVLPRKPIKPNALLTILAACMGGLFVAVVMAGYADFRSGKVLETWQIHRILGLKLLGEIDD